MEWLTKPSPSQKGGIASFFIFRIMIQITKVVLAVGLLLCLLDMPYSYFQLIRFLSLISFGFLSYDCFQNNNSKDGFIFLVLALLFQPIIKIALVRSLWNTVDIIVAIYLIVNVQSVDRDKD